MSYLPRLTSLAVATDDPVIRRAVRALEQAPKERHPAILSALRVLRPDATKVTPTLHTAGASGDVLTRRAARVVLGERPRSVAPGLTAREAARYCASPLDDLTAAEWLLEQAGIADDLPSIPRSVAVARWVASVWADPPRREALQRVRSARGPGGEQLAGALVDHLTDLTPSDVRDLRSVDDVLRRAGARLQSQLERALESRGEPLCGVPRWWVPLPCARLLRTGPDLVREGRALGHCVGTYARAVEHGRCVIVGLSVRGQRSTVEVDPRTLEVRQHKGRKNGSPPELCVRALRVCAKKWAAKKQGA